MAEMFITDYILLISTWSRKIFPLCLYNRFYVSWNHPFLLVWKLRSKCYIPKIHKKLEIGRLDRTIQSILLWIKCVFHTWQTGHCLKSFKKYFINIIWNNEEIKFVYCLEMQNLHIFSFCKAENIKSNSQTRGDVKETFKLENVWQSYEIKGK